MQIRILNGVTSTKGNLEPGEVVDLPRNEALGLVNTSRAEAINEDEVDLQGTITAGETTSNTVERTVADDDTGDAPVRRRSAKKETE